MKPTKRSVAASLCLALLLMGCSRSNNLLLGRVEAVVAGHTVIVTDCYRLQIEPPQAMPGAAGNQPFYRFTPCVDADIVIEGETLTVNGIAYGPLHAGDTVTVDHGRVLIGGHTVQPIEAGG